MDHAMVRAMQNRVGLIVKINLTQLLAAFYGLMSYWLWPQSLRGFGWGLLSIISGLIAAALIMRTLRLIMKLYALDQAIATYAAYGEAPQSATLASDEALRQAGMR